MKKVIILFLIILTACSNANNAGDLKNNPANVDVNVESSFPYPLVIWDNQKYKVTTDEKININKVIGEILNYSTDEAQIKEDTDNFSNYYPKGTQIWSIQGVDTKQAVAIEYEKNMYVKAVVE
ncbi:hypothetical protein C173_21636 [Paenibacillus sp. FSL R7-277]|uniref:hypothetical protein n=1 Tax=unclassified Paenibacillus TaxID=185978 RepID=UPI0003E2A061|nr:hypothetical protein [Paenibacillus sp. FSL R7-277]ETT64196.1 hypothetical protein C173_21636 [Paenibacillus sp. FSL R7-277]